MTTSWKTFSELGRGTARLTFEALRLRDDLELGASDSGSEDTATDIRPRVSFAEFFDVVRDPTRPLDREISAALSANPRLAADVRRLIANLAPYQGPRMAAASTGEVRRREGDGFAMEFRASRVDDAQVYVSIRLAAPDRRAPEVLFVSRADGVLLKYPLPPLLGDTVQLLLEAGSELLTALRDPSSEVFLH